MTDPTPPQQEDLLRILAGRSDVRLHRNPDGTVSVTPMRDGAAQASGVLMVSDDGLTTWLLPPGSDVWVDVEAGAS